MAPSSAHDGVVRHGSGIFADKTVADTSSGRNLVAEKVLCRTFMLPTGSCRQGTSRHNIPKAQTDIVADRQSGRQAISQTGSLADT